ncbi:ACP S-malonyltransferase [Candidatus Formimonas warabiya]|uniref:Malonyl CoA-acyl carrier protein transacylase n=1 Tax=Formimonas warabiya TaxID=1761012 RepID=A0A3G1KQE4_FORW1|nr:ACP S-malonyltransferase [Candidatus Formimonas warabiya]ATW24657.1 [acyl-carrier-protein] S-malonyltransferase [Candidatus Formimonas warabiya]
MGKIAFVFPGQGSQYVGMGKEMAEKYPQAAAVFEEADRVLGFSLTGLCWQGPEEELRKTYNTQPALLTVSVACLRPLQEAGIVPHFVAGHSLGEYSALVAAGALSFSEAVRLVRFRGKAMERAVPSGQGTMAAVLGMSPEQIQALCAKAGAYGVVEPANFNCPGQVVIAGSTPAVEKAVEMAKEMGAKRAIMLSVSGPFHSSLLVPARAAMAERLSTAEIKNASLPVVANINAQIIQDKNDIIDALTNQVNSPVLWEDSIRILEASGVDTFIEIGPGKVLTGLIKKIAKNACILNVEDPPSLENALALLKECG